MNSTTEPSVKVSTDYGVAWTFVTGVDKTTHANQAKEMTNICTKLFKSFEEFLTPISISYNIQKYPEDHNSWEKKKHINPVDSWKHELSNISDVVDLDLIGSTQFDRSGVLSIPRVRFERNNIKIRFEDGDKNIERNDCIQYSGGKPIDIKPTWDPLDLTISYYQNNGNYDVNSDFVFTVHLGVRSNIWFEQTDWGETNRMYLSAFFDRIVDEISVEKTISNVYRSSDFWSDLGIPEFADSFDPETIY